MKYFTLKTHKISNKISAYFFNTTRTTKARHGNATCYYNYNNNKATLA